MIPIIDDPFQDTFIDAVFFRDLPLSQVFGKERFNFSRFRRIKINIALNSEFIFYDTIESFDDILQALFTGQALQHILEDGQFIKRLTQIAIGRLKELYFFLKIFYFFFAHNKHILNISDHGEGKMLFTY